MSSIVSTATLSTFNFQPVNTTGGVNTNYTVPANRYARVVVTLDGDIYASNVTSGSSTYVYGIDVSNKCCTLELWLKSSDVLSYTNSTPSGYFYSGSSSGTNTNSGGAYTLTEVRVNGNVVSRIISRITAGTSASNALIYVSGNSNVAWFASEYNNA